MGENSTVAIATRVSQDDARAIDALFDDMNRADTLRVILRFALDHGDVIREWHSDPLAF